MEALVQNFQQFAAMVRWKWHFRGDPQGFYIRLKHARNTPPCPHVTSPELEGLSLLREQLLATARATLHNLKQPQSRTTVLPLTKHGWKCLRASCRVAFLGGKDGGFTLVHEDYVPRAHHEVLNAHWYREVDPETYRSETVTNQYKTLCARVERVIDEGGGVSWNLFRSFVRLGASLVATLDLAVESHNGTGFCDVPQHSQFGFLQSRRFVSLGRSRASWVAEHARSSPQGHSSVCEAHEHQNREIR